MDLIAGETNPAIRERILATKPATVLDLGCRDGLTLFVLHHVFGIKHLDGIDSCSAASVIQETNDALVRRGSASRVVDLYGVYREITRPDPREDVVKELLNEDDFRQCFNIRYETDAVTAEWGRTEYDMIICSNVLHYLSEDDCVILLDRLKMSLTRNALFYLRFKTAFPHAPLSESELRRIGSRFSRELYLQEIQGPAEKSEGNSVICTNF